MWGKIFAFVVTSALKMIDERQKQKIADRRHISMLQFLAEQQMKQIQEQILIYQYQQQVAAAIEAERRRQIEHAKYLEQCKFNTERERILQDHKWREDLFYAKKAIVAVEGYVLEKALYACQNGDISLVDNIFKRDKEITEYFWSLNPVHIAAEYNQVDIIQLMLKNGARIESKNASDQFPRDVAFDNESWAALSILDQGEKRKQAFFELLKTANMDKIEAHLKEHWDVNTIDEKGYNIIQRAIIYQRSLEIIDKLIQLGADLKYIAPVNKENAEQLALKHKLPIVAEYIGDELNTQKGVLSVPRAGFIESNSTLHQGPTWQDKDGWNIAENFSSIRTHILYDSKGKSTFLAIGNKNSTTEVHTYDFSTAKWQSVFTGKIEPNLSSWRNCFGNRTEVLRIDNQDTLFLIDYADDITRLYSFNSTKNSWEILPLGPTWLTQRRSNQGSNQIKLHLTLKTTTLPCYENKIYQEKLLLIGRTLTTLQAHCYDPLLKQWQALPSIDDKDKALNYESIPWVIAATSIVLKDNQVKLAIAVVKSSGIYIYLYDFLSKAWLTIKGPVWTNALSVEKTEHYPTVKLIPVQTELGTTDLFMTGRTKDGMEIHSYNLTTNTWEKHRDKPRWGDSKRWDGGCYAQTLHVKTMRHIRGYDRLIIMGRTPQGIRIHCYDPKLKDGLELPMGPEWSDAYLWASPQHSSTIQLNIGMTRNYQSSLLISGKAIDGLVVKKYHINNRMLDKIFNLNERKSTKKSAPNQNVPRPRAKCKAKEFSCLQESLLIHKSITDKVTQKFNAADKQLQEYLAQSHQHIAYMQSTLHQSVGRLDQLIAESQGRDVAWCADISNMMNDLMKNRQQRTQEISEIEQQMKKARREAYKKSWIPRSAGFSNRGFTFNGMPFTGESNPEPKGPRPDTHSKPSAQSKPSTSGAQQNSTSNNQQGAKYSDQQFKQSHEDASFNAKDAERERSKAKPKSYTPPKWDGNFKPHAGPQPKPSFSHAGGSTSDAGASNARASFGANASPKSSAGTSSGSNATPKPNAGTTSGSQTGSQTNSKPNPGAYSNADTNWKPNSNNANANANQKPNASSHSGFGFNSKPGASSSPNANASPKPKPNTFQSNDFQGSKPTSSFGSQFNQHANPSAGTNAQFNQNAKPTNTPPQPQASAKPAMGATASTQPPHPKSPAVNTTQSHSSAKPTSGTASYTPSQPSPKPAGASPQPQPTAKPTSNTSTQAHSNNESLRKASIPLQQDAKPFENSTSKTLPTTKPTNSTGSQPSISKPSAISIDVKATAESSSRGLCPDPDLYKGFEKLNFSTAFKATKEFDDLFGFKSILTTTAIPNYDHFKFPNTNPSAAKIGSGDPTQNNNNSKPFSLKGITEDFSNRLSCTNFKDIKNETLNYLAFRAGELAGIANSVANGIAQFAEHIVNAEQFVDDPKVCRAYQEEMARVKLHLKNSWNEIKNKSPKENYAAIYDSVSNQINEYYSLYKSGKGFEVGFKVGGLTADVASCATLGAGALKNTLKLSQITLNLAPKVGRGLYTTAEFCLATNTLKPIKQTSFLVSEFLARNSFKCPITFQFKPYPSDLVILQAGFKFRKPINKSVNYKPEFRIPVSQRQVCGGPNHPKSTERLYKPEDQQFKHHANGPGSTNPIKDVKVLQKLLDSAYSVPYKKQVYNIHERKLIKFETNERGGFHAYEVIPGDRRSVLNQIPEEVLHKMQQDGFLTSSEVRQLIKNQRI